MRWLFLLFTCLLMVPSLSWAEYDAGSAAMIRGDYARALAELRPSADQGDPRAQVLLGKMFREGLGVSKNAALAAHWYQRAAEQGLPSAQVDLGHLYRKGVGVPQSYVDAAKWYRRAAAQNLAAGQVSLGAAYFYGHGVPQDYVQAHLWFSLALRGASVRTSDFEFARRGVKQAEAKMTPEQIKDAKLLGKKWMPVAE